MDEERKSQLLTYCRLEEFAEDEQVMSLLESFYQSAVVYMEQAGVRQPEAGTPRAAQYDLCVNAMVLDWWDHRDTKEPATQVNDNPMFRRTLTQLKLTEVW